MQSGRPSPARANTLTNFLLQALAVDSSLHKYSAWCDQREPAVQIRRYVYCDVVRTQDVQRYLDPAGVQTYIINQAKVVFLNHRPQSKPAKVHAHFWSA